MLADWLRRNQFSISNSGALICQYNPEYHHIECSTCHDNDEEAAE